MLASRILTPEPSTRHTLAPYRFTAIVDYGMTLLRHPRCKSPTKHAPPGGVGAATACGKDVCRETNSKQVQWWQHLPNRQLELINSMSPCHGRTYSREVLSSAITARHRFFERNLSDVDKTLGLQVLKAHSAASIIEKWAASRTCWCCINCANIFWTMLPMSLPAYCEDLNVRNAAIYW